jgi:hypothetical protein
MLNTCFDFADVLLIGLGQTALAPCHCRTLLRAFWCASERP